MSTAGLTYSIHRCNRRFVFSALLAFAALLMACDANALPLFARQTGQNCLSCHAGGQFPELTPYGRLFKLTGYTMGSRADVPLAVMGVASMTKVASKNGSTDPGTDFPKDGQFYPTTGSVLCCGKITDNIGAFVQWTYDLYDHQDDSGAWRGNGHVDQVDLRYADRFIDLQHDLIVGATLNNNPGVTDVWNTHNSAFTPVPTYVPVSNAANRVPFDVAVTPMIENLGQHSAGVTAYTFWNKLLYAEFGLYKTAEGIARPFNEMNASELDPFSRLKGTAPYWRFALNRDWGANSAMLGVHGLSATTYSDSADVTSPTAKFTDIGIDGQYQYILDPHVVTAMFSYTHEKQSYDDALWNANNPAYVGYAANNSNTIDYLRAKITYVYEAKYGAALAYTSVGGSADSILYGANPQTPKPDSQLWVPEVFWNPVQNIRVGLQYYAWNKFAGSRSNYDGTGRNASDNNTVFFYVWAAY